MADRNRCSAACRNLAGAFRLIAAVRPALPKGGSVFVGDPGLRWL
jgi:hypothetical protein